MKMLCLLYRHSVEKKVYSCESALIGQKATRLHCHTERLLSVYIKMPTSLRSIEVYCTSYLLSVYVSVSVRPPMPSHLNDTPRKRNLLFKGVVSARYLFLSSDPASLAPPTR